GTLLRALKHQEGILSALSYLPGEDRLASASYLLDRASGGVIVWDTRRGEEVLSLPGQLAVAFSPDGKHIAAPERGKMATSWEVRVWTGKPGKKPAAK